MIMTKCATFGEVNFARAQKLEDPTKIVESVVHEAGLRRAVRSPVLILIVRKFCICGGVNFTAV